MDSDERRQEQEVAAANDAASSTPLAGSLPEFPDIAWDDFERASTLARADANPTSSLGSAR